MKPFDSRFLGSALKTLAPAYLAGAVLLLAACSSTREATGDVSQEPGKIVVVATIPLLADLAQNVGGALVEVKSVVPPGVDAHSYQTAPQDSVIISQADLTISNGAGFDDSMIPVLESARPSGAIHVVASAGLDTQPQGGQSPEDLEGDPHFWQDPLLAIHYVEKIRDGLVQADPGNAATYRQQAQDYTARLRELDREIAEILDQVPPGRRYLISHHQAFSHLANRYGWQTMALASPGASAVTPKAILRVSQIITEAGLTSVFVESRFRSPALEQVARDAGISISPLYAGLGAEAATYVEMMRFNARSLADNLR